MKLDKEEKIYSYHTFMFPFRWDKILKGDTKQLEELDESDIANRINIDKDMNSRLEKAGWVYNAFPFEENTSKTTNLDYNEYVYFHEFVRDAVYNINREFKENQTVYFYEKEYKDGAVSFKILDGQEFNLKLDGLSLRFYDTGVAILSFDIKNTIYENLEDVLKINDYFRRVYPLFLGKNIPYTQDIKKAFLPDWIKIDIPNKPTIKEDFDVYNNEILNKISLSKIIMDTLGDYFVENNEDNKNKILVRPIIDDRMFVLSWFGNDDFITDLSTWDEYKEIYDYETNNNWNRYISTASKEKSMSNKNLQKTYIKDITYAKRVDSKVLFGITRHSFVCLSKLSNSFSLEHTKTMYYQMFHLLLAQRASILRFSDEVSTLSNFRGKNNKKLSLRTQSLYKHYIKFVNKLYFREVTAQSQGIEIYNQAQKSFNIPVEINNLDSEIEELHTYINIIEDKESKAVLDNIQYIGGILLVVSVITSFFGMNVGAESNFSSGVVYSVVLGSFVISSLFIFKRKKK